MWRNYFKTAFRNLLRTKAYASINIAGLTIGLTAFWLIALYIADELSYERFHTQANRIYRVAQHTRWDGGDMHQASTSAPFAPALKDYFPQVQEATRIIPEGGGIIAYNNKPIKAEDIFFADANIFKVFTYPFLAGDANTALARPESIVLSETLARKLFGDPRKALNQTVYFSNNYPNLVTGVMRDVPANTHLRFSGLRSLPANYTDNWQNFNSYTYLLLRAGTDVHQVAAGLPAFAAGSIQKIMRVTDYRLELQPLTDIHLHSNLQYELGPNSSINRVYIFSAIALLVLAIAIINYINLSTARSSTRIREVGVRKVIGSGRWHLIGMFIAEALVLTLVSTLLAWFCTQILLPLFNSLSGKELSIWRFGVPLTLLFILAFALLTGAMSGLYPAIFLSRFKAIPALKGQMGNLSTSIFFRKSLVVFQFTITVIMIAGSLVIYRQMQFTSKKDLGFNKEQVLTFHIHDREVRKQVSAIKTQLLQNPLVQGVSAAGNPIGNNDLGEHGFTFETNDGSFTTSSKMAQELMVDAEYLGTMGIQLAQGRNFIPGAEADKYSGAIVNETLVKEMGWTNALHKRVRFKYGADEVGERTVVGVVKDFHTYSLQHKVGSMVLLMPPVATMEDNLYVKINTDHTKQALAWIEKVYKEFDRSNPVEFNFLDQNFARQYAAEQKQETLSLIFTILAVLIASLGLFGLAAFTAQQKIKEIGIRKVLGASVPSIVRMLSTDFIKLVAFAIVIATPIAWLSMHQWLQGFAYRIDIQWWIFGLAGILALFITLATISIHAIKAALANPIESLRNE
ncbi:ABC transporter permease [Paraflavitalea pollutisoli]|uniref:ABC transporter permease n=1 Tax=Paraflavitalea pollutisoli TaxID=3034143 RepID=UPI0023ECCB5D|nr:ABC transporter permease [Paraflavitalea sp. H1-2-19X]